MSTVPEAQASDGARWTAGDVPRLDGRVAVVTGANSGIGFEAALVLAQHGAQLVLACRSTERAQDAAQRISESGDGVAAPEVLELDLGSLASIRRAAQYLRERHPRIDLLINNAGVMNIPRGTTEDGFETQFGVNHLGHFALTGLLLPQLTSVPGSRIVNVSSLNHTRGRIDFDDLAYEHRYKRNGAYSRSKLANLLFTFELQRRLEAAGAPTVALAAHPGFSKTELFRHEPPASMVLTRVVGPFLWQSAAMGALPTLRAATDPEAVGGTYYGPGGGREMKGYPVVVQARETAHDRAVQERLWTESEEMTGVVFPWT